MHNKNTTGQSQTQKALSVPTQPTAEAARNILWIMNKRALSQDNDFATHQPWLVKSEELERETGFEPATPAMARQCSTAELLPRNALGKNFQKTLRNPTSQHLACQHEKRGFSTKIRDFGRQAPKTAPFLAQELSDPCSPPTFHAVAPEKKTKTQE